MAFMRIQNTINKGHCEISEILPLIDPLYSLQIFINFALPQVYYVTELCAFKFQTHYLVL